ncbi:checkpoint protein kinase [Niveomyces insectorum RCEF 264]|uniref:Checkpoint protein kinase n=1 Tax=Niveomyces insectorum RCEF 264 TaxID=1081102 RepID=A0A167VH77_9HYPO|nr:checkpoint protein kinase [Niveomyces insectorum RCEF 264]
MAASEDLISFDIIESQKENIQALPGGRSAKKLAQLYSPTSTSTTLPGGGKLVPILTPTPNPGDTKTLHDTIRADFEAEIVNLVESDDPLDVYDRYVRWTLDAYPSAQATPQSQLHVLLERATKAFVGAAQYRNDPRYLRLWLHYIHFFSDAPREAYLYLARHGIGENLALFYEEYAAWLEGATRWQQADEVYRLGIDRGARPQARLLRKYTEFEQRRAVQAPESLLDGATAPSSPALPTVRPALAAKVDPFASATAAALRDPQDPQRQQQQQQQQRQQQQASSQTARTAKPKMAIFSDAEASAPALPTAGATSKGWESIGSLAERKKENVMAAKPWAGEKLSAGGKKSVAKMQVFKDAVTVNPANGKKERVFVDLRAVYPTPEVPGTELSFEEIWAVNRGLQHLSWDTPPQYENGHENRQQHMRSKNASPLPLPRVDVLAEAIATKLVVHQDKVLLDENGALIKSLGAENRPRKKKVIELNETQIIKAKLDSPSGPKMKKKKRSSTSEPTMTMHTKAATEDIYAIFNQPIRPALAQNDETDNHGLGSDDDYETDGDYTSEAESTGPTQLQVLQTDDAGNDAGPEVEAVQETEGSVNGEEAFDARSVSEWSDYAEHKHLPGLLEGRDAATDGSEADRTHSSATAGDTGGDSGFDASNSIDRHEGDESYEADEALSPLSVRDFSSHLGDEENTSLPSSPVRSPIKQEPEPRLPIRTGTIFIPIPPEDYVAPTRPYRDPVEVANNRLPFMTPITERTESSLEFDSESNRRALHAKTPSKAVSRLSACLPDEDGEEVDEDEEEQVEEEEDEEQRSSDIASELMSSPLMEIVDENNLPQLPPVVKLPQPLFRKSPATASQAATTSVAFPSATRVAPIKGPIITDTQCNPIDEGIRAEILVKTQPPLSSFPGFYDHRDEKSEKGAEIRRYAKAVSNKSKSTNNNNSSNGGGVGGGSSTGSDRSSGAGLPVVIQFSDCPSHYTLRRELGAGAFAPVYLVENMNPDGDEADINGNSSSSSRASGGDEEHEEKQQKAVAQMGRGAFANPHTRRHPFEALKMETPPTAWEFYMMRLAHTRLGPQHRATASLAPALECHLYRDETFLFLPYYPHGTLLDVVNLFRAEPSGVMDETLAMFFAIELFRTVEALHGKNILHGDIKADNCLLRLEDPFRPSNHSSSSGSNGGTAPAVGLPGA